MNVRAIYDICMADAGKCSILRFRQPPGKDFAPGGGLFSLRAPAACPDHKYLS